MRLLGGGFLAALVVAAAAAAATSPPLPVFQRSAHAYDKLPAVAKSVGAVQVSRRVATAIDTKRRPYLVYATLMKDKSVCVLLVQSELLPRAVRAGHRTVRTWSRNVLGDQGADRWSCRAPRSRRSCSSVRRARKTISLTKDGGYIYGCPAPTNCATWVREVLGYSSAGKLISTERTH